MVGRPLGEGRARTRASVDASLAGQPLEAADVRRVVVGLPDRTLVGLEPEPGEVFHERGVERRPRPDPVVVLDPQQDGRAAVRAIPQT